MQARQTALHDVPRLRLLKDFLHDDGVVFASIDDIEITSMRLLFDEIFEVTNHVGVIVWKNATDNNPTQIASELPPKLRC